MEALYIVLPTTANVNRICEDFYIPPPPQPNKRDKNPPPPQPPQPPRYAAAHICFLGAVPDALFNELAERIPEDRLRGVKELYVHFWPIESHVFSLRSPQAFRKFYAPPVRSAREGVDLAEDELRFTSQSLVNALILLGEYPLIRYYNPNTKPLGVGVAYNEHITRRLAEMVQREMDEYCRNNSDFPPKPEPSRARGILFITERSMDLMAPLLHEFTYQAMINDLLDVQEEGTKYHHSYRNNAGVIEDKDVELTEDDDIWNETRHMHMKDALDKLVGDFKRYAGDYNKKYGGDAKGSINDMKDMLASLDSTQKNKDSLSVHLSLAEKCMAYFESHSLPNVADVEQCCATGLTAEGKAPRTLVEDMVPLLGNRTLSSKDKVRIIALYILHRNGVPEEDRKRLFQHAHLALHEMDMVNNMKYLGLDISKELKNNRKAPIKQRQLEDVYDISRYQPVLKLMLDDHIADRLDQSVFPYVKDAPHSARNSAASTASLGAPGSLRSSRPQWAERAKTRTVKEPKQRMIVFQLGGMTYSEIRSAYQVSSASNRDVFIGSSHILTPKDFLQELAGLDKGGAASMSSSLAPDSARYDKYRELNKNDKSARLTPQEGFDRRFPFVSTRPPAERQNSGMPPGQQTSIPPAPQQAGSSQMQQISNSRPQGSPMSMPIHRPQPSESRSGFSQKLLHPTSASKAPPPLKHAQSYDASFNPIPAHSPAGSRAPSVASMASSMAPQEGGKPEKEKKKKNLLKKMF
ncbi:Sec1-like protein [Cystobasidium minutum MCA 4210]|uniref:Sec1-like protein n=1 Tax=Cystobasidium minutum MCA 4210 TaxID=1397322 RepID=UPI0034CF1F83|eukprot:jgi/Rhomi1/155100/estExt_Genewise1.C_7_t10105